MTISRYKHLYRCDYHGMVAIGKTRGIALRNMLRIVRARNEKAMGKDSMVVAHTPAIKA